MGSVIVCDRFLCGLLFSEMKYDLLNNDISS